jgi:hypothetical protein
VVIVEVVVVSVGPQDYGHSYSAAGVTVAPVTPQTDERPVYEAVLVVRNGVVAVRVVVETRAAFVNRIPSRLIGERLGLRNQDIVHEMGERVVRIPILLSLEGKQVVVPGGGVAVHLVVERRQAGDGEHIAVTGGIMDAIVVAPVLDHLVLRVPRHVVVLDRALRKENADVSFGGNAHHRDVRVHIRFEKHAHAVALLVPAVVVEPDVHLRRRPGRALSHQGRGTEHRQRC